MSEGIWTGWRTDDAFVEQLEVGSGDYDLLAYELGEFFSLFDHTYRSASIAVAANPASVLLLGVVSHLRGEVRITPDALEEIQSALDEIWGSLTHASQISPLPQHLGMEGFDPRVAIRRMVMESPLLIDVVVYSVIALVVAVIVSGGEISFADMKFRLPPIGNGVLALRQAFSTQYRDSPPKLADHIHGVGHDYKPSGGKI